MPKPERTQPPREVVVGVYRHDQNRNTEPTYFVESEYAQYLVACKFAFWSGKGRLTLKEALPLFLRGPSAKIGPDVMFAACTGSRYHRALSEAWA